MFQASLPIIALCPSSQKTQRTSLIPRQNYRSCLGYEDNLQIKTQLIFMGVGSPKCFSSVHVSFYFLPTGIPKGAVEFDSTGLCSEKNEAVLEFPKELCIYCLSNVVCSLALLCYPFTRHAGRMLESGE